MRVLEFDVTRQRLIKKPDCDFNGIVAGSVGYLKAKFNFKGTSWDGCKKAASFWTYNLDTLTWQEYAVLLDTDDTCMIPHQVLNDEVFYVSVMGVKSNYKITTTKIKIVQEV